MSIVSIDAAIDHLRADSDDTADIQRKLDAAVEIAEQYIGRRVYTDKLQASVARAAAIIELDNEPIDVADSYELTMQSRAIGTNPAIEIAVLLILGTLYAHREDVVVGISDRTAELPIAATHRLQPYRVMGV